jgi:hypothetical protein
MIDRTDLREYEETGLRAKYYSWFMMALDPDKHMKHWSSRPGEKMWWYWMKPGSYVASSTAQVAAQSNKGWTTDFRLYCANYAVRHGIVFG